jgi:hypothetical protein
VIVRKLLPAAVFLAVFVAHALYSGFWAALSPTGWADSDVSASAAGPLGLWAYWRGQDYFVGFSYALGAAFASWALSRCITFNQGSSAAVGAAVGGITLVSVLMAAGCFLIGCCGSPMLAVYLALFGAKVMGLGKPLTALITLISVSCGYWCLLRRSGRGECVDACCSPMRGSRISRVRVYPSRQSRASSTSVSESRHS